MTLLWNGTDLGGKPAAAPPFPEAEKCISLALLFWPRLACRCSPVSCAAVDRCARGRAGSHGMVRGGPSAGGFGGGLDKGSCYVYVCVYVCGFACVSVVGTRFVRGNRLTSTNSAIYRDEEL